MPVLEISRTADAGERCFSISLVDDEGTTLFRTTTSLFQDVAIDTAKALLQKGPSASFVGEGPEPVGIPAWMAEKVADAWLLKFTLARTTLFDPLIKQENAGDPTALEHVVVVIKDNLRKVEELTWNPKNADPAYQEKESDVTPTVGMPGS